MFGIGTGRALRAGTRAVVIAAVCGTLCGLAASGMVLAQDAKAPIPAAVNTATVTIDNFSFSPETLSIKPGTKVTFVNHDDIPHTVVAVDKSFRSRALDTDDNYEFTFTTAGSFDYFCGLHPHMQARIIVAP